MFKLINNILPNSICSLFTNKSCVYSNFTRHCKEFHQSFARTKLSHRTVRHEGPRVWFSLDSIIKTAPL